MRFTMEDKSNKSVRKCMRKQKRAQHRLVRDMDVECSEFPTKVKELLLLNLNEYI